MPNCAHRGVWSFKGIKNYAFLQHDVLMLAPFGRTKLRKNRLRCAKLCTTRCQPLIRITQVRTNTPHCAISCTTRCTPMGINAPFLPPFSKYTHTTHTLHTHTTSYHRVSPSTTTGSRCRTCHRCSPPTTVLPLSL